MTPRIIFFGTPEFSVIIAKALIQAGLIPAAIVTTPDKPAGRGKALKPSPLKLLAQEMHIPYLQPTRLKDDVFLADLRRLLPNIFIIASYGKIIPQAALDIPPHGTINVHPSLLPEYRGPSPIQTALLNGDDTVGVTLMVTDAKMDHGPILASSKFKVQNSKLTYRELHDELAKLGGKLLVETLPKWIAGEITPQEQNHAKATFTKLFSKEDGKIDWTKSASEIDRQVRALQEWPQAWTVWHKNGKPIVLKILTGHASDEKSPRKPGTVYKEKGGQLAVLTNDYLYIVETLQPPGKKPMSGKDFLNGQSEVLGAVFE